MTFSTVKDLKIISIDPSLRSTGVFTCVSGKCEAYSLRYKDDRLELLGKYVRHFIAEAKKRYDLCIIEGYSMGSRSSSVTVQAEVGGIARACFSAVGTPIIEIPPQSWKAQVKINLKKNSVEEKRQYLNECIERFGFTFETTDECDAFYMFWSAVQISRGNFKKGTGSAIRTKLEELRMCL